METPRGATFTHIDTACGLIEVGGWRLITDPTFDAPGTTYRFGLGTSSVKTSRPALSPYQVGAVDAVLLSHDQHADNFDTAGRAFALDAPIILTTKAGAARLTASDEEALAFGMAPGASYALSDNRRPDVTITAVAARHRPAHWPEFVSGPVVGFVIESEALTGGAVYVTGDTLLTPEVRAVAAQFQVGTLIAHVGAASFPKITRKARFTMSADDVAELAREGDVPLVIPVHTSGWSHLIEGTEALVSAFAERGIARRLTVPVPGVAIALS
jgi:L-ascorbate metabolism protein UlaG (beta-lactamase superfamily)